MKDEGFEYLMSVLPAGPDKSCALNLLPHALDFVRERDTEFGTVDIQKFLKAGYGKVVKVIDAMLALCVIEVTEEKPRKYKRLCEKDEINHDIYYNATATWADKKGHKATGWDPGLFRTEKECIEYALKAYLNDIDTDCVIEANKISVGRGWDELDHTFYFRNTENPTQKKNDIYTKCRFSVQGNLCIIEISIPTNQICMFDDAAGTRSFSGTISCDSEDDAWLSYQKLVALLHSGYCEENNWCFSIGVNELFERLTNKSLSFCHLTAMKDEPNELIRCIDRFVDVDNVEFIYIQENDDIAKITADCTEIASQIDKSKMLQGARSRDLSTDEVSVSIFYKQGAN